MTFGYRVPHVPFPALDRITHDSTIIVGILNVTPDSFSDGGCYVDPEIAIAEAQRLRQDGAEVIDIGGESTRPGATPIRPEVEEARVLDVIRAMASLGIVVSVDTMHHTTACAAVDAGATIVNDVSGGLTDPEMFPALADLDCQLVIGHLRGNPTTMQDHARYADVVAEVIDELGQRVDSATAAGIAPSRIVIDPGIGFAKSTAHNWMILNEIHRFRTLECPLMVGVSRKNFLAGALPVGSTVFDRDVATAALTAVLADAGVNAIRVHDVAKNRAALAVIDLLRHGDVR